MQPSPDSDRQPSLHYLHYPLQMKTHPFYSDLIFQYQNLHFSDLYFSVFLPALYWNPTDLSLRYLFSDILLPPVKEKISFLLSFLFGSELFSALSSSYFRPLCLNYFSALPLLSRLWSFYLSLMLSYTNLFLFKRKIARQFFSVVRSAFLTLFLK